MFVRLTKPHITISGRTYAEGAVVEVDESIHKRLVEEGHAVDHAGPAWEPTSNGGDARPQPPSAPRPAAAPVRHQATERAVKL